jgi:hypothetical protein
VYRLEYQLDQETLHDALPEDVSAALTDALAVACNDPLGATRPYGVDDKAIRMAYTDQAFAVVMLGHEVRTIYVLEIIFLG